MLMAKSLESYQAEVCTWTEKERRQNLADCLKVTAENILKAAIIIGVCEDQGDDLSGFSTGFRSCMARIRAGTMLPQVYMEYDGALRRSMGFLPISEQQKLVAGGKVELVIREGGQTEVLKVDPRDLQPKQIKQVFATDHIRSTAEQRTWLEDKKPAKEPEPSIDVNARQGFIIVGGVKLTRKDLANYLAQLS